MSIKEKMGQMAGKFLKNCVEHNGTFLFGTAAAGWILASAAQTLGLIANKNITKEEKRFLVPQEILDGTFNILTYVGISATLMKGAKHLAGKNFPNQPKVVEGANTLAAIAGGIISSNIITPILRNKTSVIVKKKMEEKSMKMPPVEIYDSKTYPNFTSNGKPLTMQNYINSARHLSQIKTGGTLRI